MKTLPANKQHFNFRFAHHLTHITPRYSNILVMHVDDQIFEFIQSACIYLFIEYSSTFSTSPAYSFAKAFKQAQGVANELIDGVSFEYVNAEAMPLEKVQQIMGFKDQLNINIYGQAELLTMLYDDLSLSYSEGEDEMESFVTGVKSSRNEIDNTIIDFFIENIRLNKEFNLNELYSRIGIQVI